MWQQKRNLFKSVCVLAKQDLDIPDTAMLAECGFHFSNSAYFPSQMRCKHGRQGLGEVFFVYIKSYQACFGWLLTLKDDVVITCRKLSF